MSTNKIIVSIVIKAFNEEDKIAATIESALRAIAKVGGEVILADSHSTDRTVEIAARYPIKIARLNRAQDRCCGIGGQLGYQVSQGEYIWIVDGDMELAEGFVEKAIAVLESDPKIAGVAGLITEKNLESMEFRARLLRAPAHLRAGIVDRLDGGGVYRRAAIESIGYFTNKNLHSYEEFELAARLRANGWSLMRIADVAVSHFGHKTEAFSLLMRRWRSRYVLGIGELLRSAMGEDHFSLVLKELRDLQLYSAVIVWWISLIVLLILELQLGNFGISLLLVVIMPFMLMMIKKRSVLLGVYSVVAWNFHAMGLVLGVLKKQSPADGMIDAKLHIVELKDHAIPHENF